MLLGPFDQARAAGQIPLPPRRDHFDVWVQRISGQFKPNLIVAFARRAMRNRIRAGFCRNFDQALGDQGPCNRCTQQIIAFVPRIRPHHRENKIANKFFAQIVDINMMIGNAHQHGFFTRRPQFLALPKVSRERDHFAAIFNLQPFQDDAGIQPARISENDFFDIIFHAMAFARLIQTQRAYQAEPSGATTYGLRKGIKMAVTQNKTVATDADVTAFIAGVEPPEKRLAAETLAGLFGQVTGQPPKMWGPSIIGFGSYHYKYDSGREGDAPRCGFSPRKANIVLYLMGGYGNAQTQKQMEELRGKLGKHKVGKSCLYITKLTDVDLAVLEQIVRADMAYMDARYPA